MLVQIEKSTVLDQIEVTRSGNVQVRFALMTISRGAEKIDGYHRTTIEPGVAVEERCAMINENLATMGEAPVSAVDIAKIVAHVRLAHG